MKRLASLLRHDELLRAEYDLAVEATCQQIRAGLEWEIAGHLRTIAELRADVQELETILAGWHASSRFARLKRFFRRAPCSAWY